MGLLQSILECFRANAKQLAGAKIDEKQFSRSEAIISLMTKRRGKTRRFEFFAKEELLRAAAQELKT